jgi:hypothetical protein
MRCASKSSMSSFGAGFAACVRSCSAAAILLMVELTINASAPGGLRRARRTELYRNISAASPCRLPPLPLPLVLPLPMRSGEGVFVRWDPFDG